MQRRDIIKRALATTASGLAVTGTVTGRKTKKPKDYDKIIQQAEKLLRKSRFIDNERASERLEKNAKRLLDKNNIKYKESVGKPTENIDRDGVNIQDRYGNPPEQSDTELLLSSYIPLKEGCSGYGCKDYGTYRISINWYLYENPSFLGPDNPCPPDAAAVFWNSNIFQPVKVGRDNFYDSYSWGKNTAGDGNVSYEEYDIQHGGVLAEVDSPQPGTDGKTGVFAGGYRMKLEEVAEDPEDYPIKAKYTHNYRFEQGCLLSDYGVSLGAGGIQISPSDVKSWSMSTQESVY